MYFSVWWKVEAVEYRLHFLIFHFHVKSSTTLPGPPPQLGAPRSISPHAW